MPLIVGNLEDTFTANLAVLSLPAIPFSAETPHLLNQGECATHSFLRTSLPDNNNRTEQKDVNERHSSHASRKKHP